jgi:hypothetical protein
MARSQLIHAGASVVLGVLVLFPLPGTATAQSVNTQYAISAELNAMAEADQAERRSGGVPAHHERARLDRVHQIVRTNQLATPDDYYHAAMVLQHSRESRDHLLAHTLATAAAFRGHQKARWLSATALDRFLEWNGHKQFFGTQYTRNDQGALQPGPFDEHLSESLRRDFAVPPLEEMQQRASEWNRSRP